MVIEHPGAEHDIDRPDSRQRVRRSAIAEHELDARVPGRVRLFELRSRAEHVYANHARGARFFSRERVRAVDAPHASDVDERSPAGVLSNQPRQVRVIADGCAAAPHSPAPQDVQPRNLK